MTAIVGASARLLAERSSQVGAEAEELDAARAADFFAEADDRGDFEGVVDLGTAVMMVSCLKSELMRFRPDAGFKRAGEYPAAATGANQSPFYQAPGLESSISR